jgi:hypothetical protein
MFSTVITVIGWIKGLIDLCLEAVGIKKAQEKDRPCFRVDVSKGQTALFNVPGVVVKIHSLGSLPLEMYDGQVFIKTGLHPEGVQHQTFPPDTHISALHPIERMIPLPGKYVNSQESSRAKSIQVVVDFYYGKKKEHYHVELHCDIPNWYF